MPRAGRAGRRYRIGHPLAAIASARHETQYSIIPFLGEAMNSYKHPLRVGVGGPVGSGKPLCWKHCVKRCAIPAAGGGH